MTAQEPDPPDPRLVALAGIAILSRVLERDALDGSDRARLGAFLRALKRLRDHLEDNGS